MYMVKLDERNKNKKKKKENTDSLIEFEDITRKLNNTVSKFRSSFLYLVEG